MTFQLTETQEKELNEWRDKVRELFGDIGQEQFIFTPSGIGDSLLVKNITYNCEIDLTHTEEW